MAKLGLPSESDEQKAVVKWLRTLGYTPMAIENEQTIQPKQSADRWRIANHRKAMGQQRGAPDFLIVEPSPFTGRRVVVEMKKRKGGRIKDHQKEIHEMMRRYDYEVVVGFGSDDARMKLQELGYGARPKAGNSVGRGERP